MCLSVFASLLAHVTASPIFLSVFTVALAQYSSGSIAMFYIFPVL